jgi:hypothetical protein
MSTTDNSAVLELKVTCILMDELRHKFLMVSKKIVES